MYLIVVVGHAGICQSVRLLSVQSSVMSPITKDLPDFISHHARLHGARRCHGNPSCNAT